jgi:hypothetical protein
MIEIIAEGQVVAEKTGLGVQELLQFIEMMFPGPYGRTPIECNQETVVKENSRYS